MARVRGRTRAQLQADRAEVRDAKEQALRVMVESGALHPCAEHDEVDESCARCAWVNEQLGFEAPRSRSSAGSSAGSSASSSSSPRRDADYWRRRCPVTPADVKEFEITWEVFDAWADARGLTPMRRPPRWHEPQMDVVWTSDIGWGMSGTFYGAPAAWPGNRAYCSRYKEISAFIRVFAPVLKLAPFELLDEIAKHR